MEGEFRRAEIQRDEPVVIDWDLRTDFGWTEIGWL